MTFWFEILRLVKNKLFWNVERAHNVSAEYVAHIVYKGTISDYYFEPQSELACSLKKNVIQYIYVQVSMYKETKVMNMQCKFRP